MSQVPIVVVKIGGSLLVWDELPRRLRAWLDEQPPAAYVLIAGTGLLGDFVRQADERFRLGPERSHWLCIDALSMTARMLSQILTDVPLVDSLASIGESAAACVLDPRPFLLTKEASAAGVPLPHTWDATTDSIAARVAECLHAEGLVLLKSCNPPVEIVGQASRLSSSCNEQTGRSPYEAASRAGFVDRYFPVAAARLPRVECVNLRGSANPITLTRPLHD